MERERPAIAAGLLAVAGLARETAVLGAAALAEGVAGVPRASLVVIAATLSQFSLPEEGLLLILGIDTFLDMGRSATNVIGNSLATAVVAKWEGQLISDLDTQEMIEEMEVEPA